MTLYEPNTKQWKVGDLVIHDADRKEARMLMEVVRVVDDNRYITRYINHTVSNDTVYWSNSIEVLHDPTRFDIDTATIGRQQSLPDIGEK